MFPILNIGPLAIQTPGLLIIIGVYISVLVLEKQSKRYSLPANHISNLIFIYLLSIVIIGRLSYLIQYPSIFFENPLSIFSISPSFFDFSSGIILSLLVAWVFIQKKKLPFLRLLDALSLPLLVFLVFLFFSFFASGDFFGKPSTLPWAISLWGTTRHPLQIYYLLGMVPVIAVNMINSRQHHNPGYLFLQTIFALTIMVIFLDYFNGNPTILDQKLNYLQIIAWIIMVALIFLKAKINKLPTKPAD